MARPVPWCNTLYVVLLIAPSFALSGSDSASLPGKAREFRAETKVRVSSPFEPTVTQEEADLLKQATDLLENNRSEAIRLVEEARSGDSSAALDFALGNFYYQGERFNQAAQAYEAALHKLPLFRSALNNLGRVYMLQEDLAKAVETFQVLLRSGQANADMLVLLGHAHLLQDKPVSAEGAYRQALTLQADEPDAARGLIRCLIEQQRTHEVLGMTEELLRNEFYDGELWVLRANAYLMLDRMAEAITAIEVARRLGLANPDLLATLGDLYLNRLQPMDAVEAYEEAFVSDDRSLERMLRASEGLLLVGKLDAAEGILKLARTMDETGQATAQQHQKRLWLEAQIANARGNKERARQRYEALIQDNPLDAQALLALADMEISEGSVQKAKLLFERASRIDGFEARALLKHAQLEVQTERYREAITLLEAAQAFEERPHVARYMEQVRRLVAR